MTDSTGDPAMADALQSLVSEGAAECYLELLAGSTDVNPDDPAIDELVRSGLIGLVTETGEPFVHPPRLALARAAQQATRRWLAAAPDFEALGTLIDSTDPTTPTDMIPSEVEDLAERQQALEALVIGATSELSALQPYFDEMAADDAEEWTSQADATLTARLTCRTVYDERLFDVANFDRAVHEEVALGAQVRITSRPLAGFLLIADQRAAAYTPAPDAPGRITSESSLVALLQIAFDAVWAGAMPLGHHQELSDDHMTVLTLVGLGHTNRQIGSKLKLNERTIRRRVNDLLDHFGESERGALVRRAALESTAN